MILMINDKCVFKKSNSGPKKITIIAICRAIVLVFMQYGN